MNCPACGHGNPDDAGFCGECGGPLAHESACPACGRLNPSSTKFCHGCGRPLGESTAITGGGGQAPTLPDGAAAAHPASFCEGRYEVKRFLGEGGKKRVYLAHDAKLDRDVAFALIKTEGLDQEGLLRIKREAQAMGRLGDHPHIVSVYDIGEIEGQATPPLPGPPPRGGEGTPSRGERTNPIPTSLSQPYLVSQLMGGGDV